MGALFLNRLHHSSIPRHSVFEAQRGGKRSGHHKKAKLMLRNGARLPATQILSNAIEDLAALLRSQLAGDLIRLM